MIMADFLICAAIFFAALALGTGAALWEDRRG